MSVFLEVKEVAVVKGYMSIEGNKVNPVTNPYFVAAQQEAEFVIELAKAAKGKNFVANEVDSMTELISEVRGKLSATAVVEHVKTPKEPTMKLKAGLATEALAYMQYGKDLDKADKINAYLQRFNVISEFETIGLFFEDGMSKINEIYTMAQITKAVTETIDLLD